MKDKQVEISNTLVRGKLTEIRCVERFLELGYIVSVPEIPCPYDLLLDTGRNIFKVQVKTSRLSKDGKDSIVFNTRSVTHNSHGYTTRQYSEKDVDYFATYWEGNAYLIPFELCGKRQKCLKLSPPLNNQVKNISFAKDYLAEKVLGYCGLNDKTDHGSSTLPCPTNSGNTSPLE